MEAMMPEIRDLTAEEYDATYDDPGTTGGHEISADVLAAAVEAAEKGGE